MSQPLPLCVIGGGAIGFRHASVAGESPAVRLTAVIEPDCARREELKQYGFPVVADVEAAPVETRAAIVATPTPAHLGAALKAFDRGWAVLVEKPIAADLAEAEALCAASEAAGLPLVTGHHRRCHPFMAGLRDRLTEIGAIVGLQGLWCLRKHDGYFDPLWRRKPGAGPIMTNLSHEIDLLRYLTGEISEVTALVSNAARSLEIEDTAALSFRFDCGALGSFLISDAGASPWSFELATGENPDLPPTRQDYFRFVGERGAMGFPSGALWLGDEPGEIEWRKPLTPRRGLDTPRIDPLLEQVGRFARLVEGDAVDLPSGRDGLATLAATLATRLSAREGRPCAPSEVPADYRGA